MLERFEQSRVWGLGALGPCDSAGFRDLGLAEKVALGRLRPFQSISKPLQDSAPEDPARV